MHEPTISTLPTIVHSTSSHNLNITASNNSVNVNSNNGNGNGTGNATAITTITATTSADANINATQDTHINNEDYRSSDYETSSYMAAQSVADSGGVGLYPYTVVGVNTICGSGSGSGVSGNITAPPLPPAVPSSISTYCLPHVLPHSSGGGGDFVGTLKRNSKGSSVQSPQRARKTSTTRHGTYCSCFGGRRDANGRKIVVAFWPTLLANLSIFALLLLYTLMGSFIFLTIENTVSVSVGVDVGNVVVGIGVGLVDDDSENDKDNGDDDDGGGGGGGDDDVVNADAVVDVDAAEAMHFVHMPQQQTLLQPQQTFEPSVGISVAALASVSARSLISASYSALTSSATSQTLPVNKDNVTASTTTITTTTTINTNINTNTNNAEISTHNKRVSSIPNALVFAASDRRPRTSPNAGHGSTSLLTAAASAAAEVASAAVVLSPVQIAPEPETYIARVHGRHKRHRGQQPYEQQKQQQQQQQHYVSNKAHVNYDVQTLTLDEAEAQSDAEAESEETIEENANIAEDLERQRTVENIWDITVSLNILYKENWTKLAALEIAKFQDRLVRRFVMDLTLPTVTEAHSSATAAATSTSSATAAGTITGMGTATDAKSDTTRGRNILRQSATMHQNVKHFNGQQRHWQLQHTRQRLLQQQRARQYRQQQLQRQQQHLQRNRKQFEWNFATAFLYSLTVITTVGYGTITPRTTCGRMVTIAYATLGIPLTLVYLSSMGGLLAKLMRIVCTRLLCCCLCRPHASCAGFGRQQQVSDRKCDLKLKQLQQRQQHQQQQQQQQHTPQKSRQQQQQQQQQHTFLPYCYVRPPAEVSGMGGVGVPVGGAAGVADGIGAFDTLSVATTTATESRHSGVHALSWSLVVPVALCLFLLLAYVCVGAVVMALLEHWSLLDGVYFCCMSLTTIGFCDLLPGLSGNSVAPHGVIWFCALYILSGLTLTSMCVNLLHEEILLRMRVVVSFQKVPVREGKERVFYGAPPP